MGILIYDIYETMSPPFLIHCLVATLEMFCAGSSESMPLHLIQTSLKHRSGYQQQ